MDIHRQRTPPSALCPQGSFGILRPTWSRNRCGRCLGPEQSWLPIRRRCWPRASSGYFVLQATWSRLWYAVHFQLECLLLTSRRGHGFLFPPTFCSAPYVAMHADCLRLSPPRSSPPNHSRGLLPSFRTFVSYSSRVLLLSTRRPNRCRCTGASSLPPGCERAWPRLPFLFWSGPRNTSRQ